MAACDNKLLVATILTIVVIFVTISTTTAQNGYYNTNYNYNYNYYAEKPGSCAPALPLNICIQTCAADRECQGNGKCCPTACGGTACSRPVTMRRPGPAAVKAGFCPAIPTGRWVCSATCSTDGDCPGVRKCCKNRCGAMACQTPEAERVGSDDSVPYVQPNPYITYVGRK